ncbi:Vi polysaccharide biosynthesis protein VipA/TviB [Jannaschia sp. EhC01]|nr:Vi polysaccharide biosynthesis protein VipA/TviB [Jannaschia sp. EhC01]
MDLANVNIAVVGLGYVGLPLALSFSKARCVVGFDIAQQRIADLRNGVDATLGASAEDLRNASNLTFSTDPQDMASCNVYIITVPTPIDDFKRPDLRPLIGASRSVGSVLSKGDLVIYESTVYPGATEEDCVPILEEASGLRFNDDFVVGYSPERINPGDKVNTLETITKITSGSTPEAAKFVDDLYGSIITAGTHLAPSIRVAEAAKVIENTQRDINIALMNEFALIFERLGVNTLDVLEAAGTKWNFLPFRPGLVGGHCIGVDPYYLTHKAKTVGYDAEIVLAGRKINDAMGSFIAKQMIRQMILKSIPIKGCRILLMGLTFKENCPDLRNTRVVDLITELESFGICVDVHDPWADPEEALSEYGITLVTPEAGAYDGILVPVCHEQFLSMTNADMRKLAKPTHVIYDVKGALVHVDADLRL